MIRLETNRTNEARLQHRLEIQCALIEELFRSYGQYIHISDGYVETDWIRYDTPAQPAGQSLKMLETALAHSLGVATRVKQQGNALAIWVKRPRPAVDLLDLMQSHRPATDLTGVLGLAENGRPVQVDFNQVGHILVAGNSHSGKTNLLQTLVASLVVANPAEQVRFLVIQGPLARGLSPLNCLPAAYLLRSVITEAADAARSLDQLAAEVESSSSSAAGPQTVVLIDRVEEVLEMGKLPVLAPLARLLASNNSVSLLLSTGRPESDLFNYLSSGISTRLVGQVTDRSQARAATGIIDSRAEQLPDRGAFLLVRENRMTYFQAAYADRYDLSFLMLRLRQDSASSLPKSRPRQLTSSQPATYITPYQ